MKNLTPSILIDLSIERCKEILEHIDSSIEKRNYTVLREYNYTRSTWEIRICITSIKYGIDNIEEDIIKKYLIHLGWSDVIIDKNTSTSVFNIKISSTESYLKGMIKDKIKNSESKEVKFLSIDEFVKTQMKI